MPLVPNLYHARLPRTLEEKAEADPFGTVTLWTYFYNCLEHLTKWTALEDGEILQTAEQDLVVAAFKLYAGCEAKTPLDQEFFIKLLNRCVICMPDIVEGADSWMEDETGVSAFKTPNLLQLVVAVAIKHVNHDVLVNLSRFKLPPVNLFTTCLPAVTSYLEMSSLPPSGWDALQHAGWIEKSQRPEEGAENASSNHKRSQKFDNAVWQGIGAKLDSCALELPPAELRAYFSHIPRTLYSGISPQPKWPGYPMLVKYAASRTDGEGVEVLRLLIEIGGLDVNDNKTWWKAGDHDPRAWEPKCQDESDCSETPLHIAVDKGNVDIVHFLLDHGAKRLPDTFGRDQRQRAELRGNMEIIEAFEQHGWLSHGGQNAEAGEHAVYGQQWSGWMRSLKRN